MNIQNLWNLYSNIQNSCKSCTFCKFRRIRRKSCKSHRNKNLWYRNSSVCSKLDKDNNRFWYYIRYGLTRRNLRGWKSKYPTGSSYCRCSSKYTRSHPCRLFRKTKRLKTYSSDILTAYSRFRRMNHKSSGRKCF